MQRSFTLDSREFTLWYATGTVKDVSSGSTTSIHGSIEGGKGSIHSETTVWRKIWFECKDTGTDYLISTEKVAHFLEGHTITAVGIRSGNYRRWVYLFNHNAQSWWQLMLGSDFLSELYVNVGCCGSVVLSAVLLCVAFIYDMKYYFIPLIGTSNGWMYGVALFIPVMTALLNHRRRSRRSRIYIENLRQFLTDLGLDDSRIY